MYKLCKEFELYLPRNMRVRLSVERRDFETLPHWMYELPEPADSKEPLPKHYYYLDDLVNGVTRTRARGIETRA